MYSNCIIYDQIKVSNYLTDKVKQFSNKHDLISITDRKWTEFFTNDFVAFIESILPLERVQIFTKPNFWNFKNAHIDSGKIYALNVVYVHTGKISKPSYMEWFDIVHQSSKKETLLTMANTPYLDYKENEIQLIETQCLDNKLSLVRVDIPHRVITGFNHRTCFSFRFIDKFKSWEEVKQYFIDLPLNFILK